MLMFIAQIVAAISDWKLAEALGVAIVKLVMDVSQSMGKAELSNRLSRLRSDAALAKQIEEATGRATTRWAKEYPDNELVAAIAVNTTFINLPVIKEAIQAIVRNPFNPFPSKILQGKFAEILPPRFEPPRIEKSIAFFLEILREEFVAIADLRPVLDLVAEIQTARSSQQQVDILTSVLPRIEAILKRIESVQSPTEQTLYDYLTWVSNQYLSIEPPGLMQPIRQIQVRLDEMYVPLSANAVESVNVVDKPLQDQELDALLQSAALHNTEEGENLREDLVAQLAYQKSSKSSPPIELIELVRSHNKLVLLGGPGAGKTTLLRYLAMKHATALLANQRILQDLGEARLPLYLRIAHFAEGGEGRSLGDFLIQSIRGEAYADTALAALAKEWLAQGRCLILLDGMDEIIELSKRAEIARQVDALIRMCEKAGNRFIITSRVAGYRFAQVSGDIPHFSIRDLDEKQIHIFLEHWFKAAEVFETPDASSDKLAQKPESGIDGITRAIAMNPGVRKLASNPLLLNTIAFIHRKGARLPQRRIELYRSSVAILLRNWELARGIPETALIREANANRLLSELAEWIHETKPAGIAHEGEVREKLAHVIGSIQGKEPDHPDILSAVSDFLSRIREHSGIFVERTPRRYGFIHSTYQEYFAARWLVARPPEAARRIRNHLHRPHWDEPIMLAIGYYGIEFPEGVDDLVEDAILGKNLGGSSPYESILHRDLIFALRCLGDQEVEHAHLLKGRIIKEIVDILMGQMPSSEYPSLLRHLAETIRGIQDSRLGFSLREKIVDAMNNSNEDELNSAAYALSNTVLDGKAVQALLNAMLDENNKIRSSVVFALQSATLSTEAVDALLCALQDENSSVRASAATALGNVTLPPQAVTALLGALRDKDSKVRAIAAEALSNATLSEEALGSLLTALRDKNSKIRASAADALGKIAFYPSALEALLNALRDQNSKVRASAADALKNTTTLAPEAVTALLAALRDENTKVRLSATDAIRKTALSTEAVTVLLGSLQDENTKVRNSAADALRNGVLSSEAVAALVDALKDEDDRVRATAAVALRNASLDTKAVTALLECLRDPSARVRGSAAVSLSNASLSAEAINILVGTMQDENDHVRACSVDALRNATAQPRVISALLVALHDENNKVRARAVNALSNTTLTKEAVTVLLDDLQDKSSNVRAAAADALSNTIPSKEAIVALVAALGDKASVVRASAANALGNATFSSQVVNALLSSLNDQNRNVRICVINALANATAHARVIASLIGNLGDADENIRVTTVTALRQAVDKPEVVTALLHLMEDESEDVRISAADALQDATINVGAVTTLLAALCDENEHLRASAATALRNAKLSPEAITALLLALRDEHELVRASAADALAFLVRQGEAKLRLLPTLADDLATNLSLPELDKITEFGRHPKDSLFEALYAIAPCPTI